MIGRILLGALATFLCVGCDPRPVDPDAGPPVDGGAPDAGKSDAGRFDAGPGDSGVIDAGSDPAIIILMIGDGMGPGQLEAASLFRHGQPGKLFMQSLPHRGQVLTGSLSGITDSAASATTLSTGERTYNAKVGLDRLGAPAKTLVEQAHELGLRAGVVTTASVSHATPAAFTAHQSDRNQYLQIAEDQARDVRPDVMLGGGTRFFLPAGPGSDRTDLGLLGDLADAGFQVARTRTELDAIVPGAKSKVAGLFAPEHLDYVRDRAAATPQPTLSQMSISALTHLAAADRPFFLMIEGARIDMASHLNDLPRAVDETLAFDDTIRAVTQWAQGRANVTLIVTADHECGGLEVTAAKDAGVLPDVKWRWLEHTNARVSVFGQGPGTQAFDGQLVDQRWLHAAMRARLTAQPFVAPPRLLVPDGHLADLRHSPATQLAVSGYGVGINQLDKLVVDADAHGLAVGIEGLWEWQKNALVLLIDVDFGASTGPASLNGALSDTTGTVDAVLSALSVSAPPVTGFGADLALVSFGGTDVRIEDLLNGAGLRGLRAPYGLPANLGWLPVAANFGEGVRTTTPVPVKPGEGYEALIQWSALYPALAGKVPANATIAVVAILVNDDGGHTSNQALPPFVAGTANPGRVITALPGVVVFQVDDDGDGVADGNKVPTRLP
ncbi:MAG: alkaline phosphatase [Myxococcaceae bacterium]|nr:alkaline phosphatase [Myxococcaceae bacterium]